MARPSRGGSRQQDYDLGIQLGEMKGTQQAMLGQLQTIANELVRMNTEIDKKHGENIRLIESRTGGLSEVIEANKRELNDNINAHKADDVENFKAVDKNFKDVFKSLHQIFFTVTGVGLSVGILWAIARFFMGR